MMPDYVINTATWIDIFIHYLPGYNTPLQMWELIKS